jgi:hypothetical protein
VPASGAGRLSALAVKSSSIDLPSEPLHRLVGVHAILTRFRNKAATKVFYHVVFLTRVC